MADSILADAAFGLFSASTHGRYAAVAHQAAERAGLREALAFDERTAAELVERCRALAAQLRQGHQRDVAEVELAVILSALGASPLERVERLLQDLGLAVEPPMGWVAALARHLNAERITNASVQVLVTGVSGTVAVGAVTSSSADRHAAPRPRNPGRVEPIAA